LEVTRLIVSLSDHPDLEPIVQNQASNEIPDQYLCSDKAQEILGWRPQYSMAQGLEQTITWYRAYLQQEGLLA
jgi:nucleoside-diphosphate-sugar epimerase